jgi:hypothetical protein
MEGAPLGVAAGGLDLNLIQGLETWVNHSVGHPFSCSARGIS